MKGITVIQIGTGRFGRHYSRILASLNGANIPDIPRIDTLVITKTDATEAEATAAVLLKEHQATLPNVIGAKVACNEDLSSLIGRHPPDLTCIVATDKRLGNDIHANYSEIALKMGGVLCEKPFSDARGDGASLALLDKLYRLPNSGQFGLELPLVIAREQLLSKDTISKSFLNTNKLNFHWGSINSSKTDLIENLAVHPWSLIPDYFKVEHIKLVGEHEKAVTIQEKLKNTLTQKKVEVFFTLSCENNFRGLETDDLTMVFRTNGSVLDIVPLPCPMKEAIHTGIVYDSLPVLDTIHSPITQHIIAVMKGSPIVGLEKTRQSQLFLEMLKGYRNETR